MVGFKDQGPGGRVRVQLRISVEGLGFGLLGCGRRTRKSKTLNPKPLQAK